MTGPRLTLLPLATIVLALVLPSHLAAARQPAPRGECIDWQQAHPEWIFCDDFEDASALVRPGRYFEHQTNDGDFSVLDGVGSAGSRGIRALWQPGEVGAGSLLLGFGRNPNGYMRKGIRPNEDFREIWYRMLLRHQPGWRGNPAKLSRATVFTGAETWSQAMIAHLWGGPGEALLLDPVRCVDPANQVKCTQYNDFARMDWLGQGPGQTPVFGAEYAGRWICVEHHLRLNDAGAANGVSEFWVDGQLEARRAGLDFVRSYRDYGINAVFFENYWNDGSPQTQWRVFDDIVVSTAPIGCPATAPTATPTLTPTATLAPTSVATAMPSVTPDLPTPTPIARPTWTARLALPVLRQQR